MSAPLYMQIKQFILDKIETGEWMTGQRIATEFELTEQFEVSRMTVNKAIRDLVNEGRLQRRPRLGTFVCDPVEKSESPLLDIRNIAAEVRDRGREYRSKVLKQVAIKADATIATKLGVMLGTTVFYSEIIHYEDSTPIQLELRWVNSQYAPSYLDQDFTHITPNQFLSDNCPLSAIEHTVEAIVPDNRIKLDLNMSSNEPCLLLNRRTWSQDKLVSTALLYHPGNKYKLSSKVLI
ncbi:MULTISPECIES: histidine utilization repressor [Vibrio]|jgi:GntR family histidine utilization transcriptional repressor|uniref:Histidine utilization repressor n=1 Tax=Vibrio natriegens NBRC 15636 = ATCC 14048 = DSM 759 TaxID=1219067 RepID=A0AAN0Y235_VIBNA|nr:MULTISPECIES: histidine utilization repressor [Vibrio]MEE3878142.1 histidine utilization repressor [Vibrio sp. YYF0003]CAH0529216.1 putative HTH-type transcriptional regulator YurK [Catenococcus thiocycli]ALR15782.1 histidine utilization repressor [Vibrio natriegens NBRC 15636 = ATCC 14048 = DSM 759]ANQ12359.1 histidine utilization repressor [Vibrio natriegens NBRC 15636 = ATCC 14048 = DSM 759]ANQ21382.1 histidine utilization repressor [Vibrio natriegens]